MSVHHELSLYYRPTCPFCIKVLDFIDRKSVTISLIDISQDRDAATTLIEVGRKQQVPCLFIDGKALYESSDIISWIDEHLCR